MIFVTGDLHGSVDIGKINPKSKFRRTYKDLTKKDYLIICGDFGVIWKGKPDDEEKRLLGYLDECPWTTLFIDGNHENFDRLKKYKKSEWKCGQIQKITDSVYHLMRGQVFEIENKTFFTMGGGKSYDQNMRTPYVSWWPEEIPNFLECVEGMKNLEKYNNEVDYFITHTCSHRIMDFFIKKNIFRNVWEDHTFGVLDEFEKIATIRRHWFFGHFHKDVQFGGNVTCLYNKVIKLD